MYSVLENRTTANYSYTRNNEHSRSRLAAGVFLTYTRKILTFRRKLPGRADDAMLNLHTRQNTTKMNSQGKLDPDDVIKLKEYIGIPLHFYLDVE